jgi:hypothetical protein
VWRVSGLGVLWNYLVKNTTMHWPDLRAWAPGMKTSAGAAHTPIEQSSAGMACSANILPMLCLLPGFKRG